MGCKHSEGFRLALHPDYPAVWTCQLGCGYFLNFDPSVYPYGVAFSPTPVGKDLKSHKLSEGGKL